MPVYPPTLPPLCKFQGASQTTNSAIVRSNVIAGPAFTRPRTKTVTEPSSFSVVFNREQLIGLKVFHRDTLMNGSKNFEMADPIFGDQATWRFLAPPFYQFRAGRLFDVEVQLERLP